MADIKLRIEVNPNVESEFLGAITNNNASVSNTSIKVDSVNQFVNPPTTEFSGSNGLLWGEEDYLVFNDNDELDNVENTGGYLESEDDPDEFFWGLVPQNKEYSVKLTFTGASNLKDIVVFGDKVNNQFPTEAIVDGETTIYNDDYHWAINLGIERDTHTIEFTKWNKANYNACLTLIRVMLRYWEVDKFNGLKSVESLSQSTGQPKEIFYGVVPNQGSAEIIDVDGEIVDMVSGGIIPNSDLPLEIYVNGKQIQKHITIDSDYNVNSKIFSINVVNQLDNWDKLNYLGRSLTKEISAYGLMVELLSDLGFSYNTTSNNITINEMLLCDIIRGENNYRYPVKEYLKGIIISYPYLNSSTYREAIDKVCALAQLQVLYNDNGNLQFVDARPIIDNSKNIVKIYPKNIIGKIQRDIILRNTYDNIKIVENTITTNISNISIYTSPTIKAWIDYETYNQSELENEYNKNLDVDYFEKEILDTTAYFQRIRFQLIPEFGFDFETTKNNIFFTITQEFLRPDGSTNTRPFTFTSMPESEADLLGFYAREVNYLPDAQNTDIGQSKQVYVYYDEVSKTKITGYLLFYVGFYRSSSNLESFGSTSIEILVSNTLNRNNTDIIVGDGNNTIEISSNELLQNETTFNGEKISNIISQNILEDYNKGILTMELTISCTDYNNINGNKIIDWSKGETLQIGDVVRIDKDNNGISAMKYANGEDMYFRVTGRRFRYAGVPLIDLELQEVKLVNVK